ncbi:MAG TPA: hypothetical protein VMM93_14290 [Vicinamibacterales bacterium]|nr:hypothetical protein [Vicinamibacterales bacterium]
MHLFFLAQQSLSWFDEAKDGLWDLWLWFNRALRDGTVAWVLLVVAAFLIYQRFFRK